MKQRILYLINPISGTARKQGIAALVDRLTDRERYDVEVVYTEYAGHGTELAKEAVVRGIDVVVAVGGDGTVNEVGRALVGTSCALAVIPCGSGNGLARHLGIPLNAKKAVEIINRGVVHELDYGTINDHPFFCTCGVGFDAFICERFAQAGKRGLMTYIENTLTAGLQYEPQTYIIEGENGTESCRAFLIACANASQYGNDAYIAPFASMKDGLLDVVVIEPFSTIESPQVALQLFNGTLPDNSHVRTFKAPRLKIRRETPGIAHYDGDPFVTTEDIDITIHQGSFRVVVNPDKNNRRTLAPAKNLAQFLPDFFEEWRQKPEALFAKAARDLKRLNNSLPGRGKK